MKLSSIVFILCFFYQSGYTQSSDSITLYFASGISKLSADQKGLVRKHSYRLDSLNVLRRSINKNVMLLLATSDSVGDVKSNQLLASARLHETAKILRALGVEGEQVRESVNVESTAADSLAGNRTVLLSIVPHGFWLFTDLEGNVHEGKYNSGIKYGQWRSTSPDKKTERLQYY